MNSLSATENQEQKDDEKTWNVLGLAMELGYTIAIPIVLFGVGGAYLDKQWETSPIFLLIGVVVSIILSIFGIYRKTRNILK